MSRPPPLPSLRKRVFSTLQRQEGGYWFPRTTVVCTRIAGNCWMCFFLLKVGGGWGGACVCLFDEVLCCILYGSQMKNACVRALSLEDWLIIGLCWGGPGGRWVGVQHVANTFYFTIILFVATHVVHSWRGLLCASYLYFFVRTTVLCAVAWTATLLLCGGGDHPP